jgi:raffinose/stachyose/melibiose transport system permease protein
MFRYTRLTLVREVLVVLAAILLLAPFYFLFVMAFKDSQEALTSPAFVPAQNPTLENFTDVLGTTGSRSFINGFVNSVVITGGSILVLIVLGAACAYTISRRPGKLSGAMYALFVVGIILPFQLGMIPLYVVLRNLHLVGTQIGMIILYSGLLMPLAVFLYSGFVRSIPKDYEEAANLDGASRWRIFTRIVFPLLNPATGTVAILAGLIIWNDFFTSLIFLNGSGASTLPVVVYSFVGEQASQWNLIFAAVIISMIPILVFYLLAQKKFIQGVSGGIKS